MSDSELNRQSVVEEVASLLRGRIAKGELRSGQRLREQQLAESLGVSRNTLRESFRILVHEEILRRENHRGVVVRELSEADVGDIFTSRRIIECAAIREIGRHSEPDLDRVRVAVEEGESAARAGLWSDVASADIAFHTGIVSVAGSRHLDRLMAAMAAELRLAFSVMQDIRAFHEPFLSLNREIYERLRAGKVGSAEELMGQYLERAEQEVRSAILATATVPPSAAGASAKVAG